MKTIINSGPLRVLLLLVCLRLVLPVFSDNEANPPAAGAEPTARNEAGARAAAPKRAESLPLKPGPDDGRIAHVTARMLQQSHYSRLSFDDTVSSRFLDRFLNSLDPQHMHFLQSDAAGFERYRESLDDMILKRGDTTPAYVIFNRFLERLEQRLAYVEGLLDSAPFEFTADERIVLNRRELPYPKDIQEARQLWRDRLRYEYLQEKLNLARPPKPKAPPSAPPKADDDDGDKSSLESAKTVKVRSPQEIHEEIVNTLKRRYHRTLRSFRDWGSEEVLELFLTALARVYDPHSDYLGKSQTENFAISMNLSLFGIGAVLTSEDGYCKIQELKPGPAQRSKQIKPNDRIVAVAQGKDGEWVDVVDMPLRKVVDLIRGPKDTVVQLKIIPAAAHDPSERVTVTLVRDQIKLEDQEAKAKIIDLPADNGESVRLGVIDLPSFYASFDMFAAHGRAESRSTAADVAKLIRKLKQEEVSGIILDLRRNGGGALDEAIRLTGLFIKQGPVVQVGEPDGTVLVDEDKDPAVLYEGPLLVLTSRFSASASEILAGALQDYGRALIVGESSTHGKGTVQSLTDLKRIMRPNTTRVDPGALKITIRKFYRPSGSSTQVKGVVPDIVLPSLHNVWDVGEGALENPLEWDTIEGAKFERVNRVAPYLEELRKRSTRRVASEREFDYVREDIELYQKAQADKSISLNEAQRLQEKEEADARQKARQQERSARKEPEHKVYELTLKLAEQPGLPPPLARTNAAALAHNTGSANHSSAAAPTGAAAGDATASPLDKEDSDSDQPADDSKVTPLDFVLQETEFILMDYLSLLPKDAVLTVNQN